MTIGGECKTPRWGGAAQGSDIESPEKSQQQSGFDFRTLQVLAGSGVNDSGTSGKIGTRLTQSAADMFSDRSRLLRVAAVQLPRLSAEDRAALLPYVKREMER